MLCHRQEQVCLDSLTFYVTPTGSGLPVTVVIVTVIGDSDDDFGDSDGDCGDTDVECGDNDGECGDSDW